MRAEDEVGCVEGGGGESGAPVVVEGEQGYDRPGLVRQVVGEAALVVVGGDGEGEPAVVGDPVAMFVSQYHLVQPCGEAACADDLDGAFVVDEPGRTVRIVRWQSPCEPPMVAVGTGHRPEVVPHEAVHADHAVRLGRCADTSRRLGLTEVTQFDSSRSALAMGSIDTASGREWMWGLPRRRHPVDQDRARHGTP